MNPDKIFVYSDPHYGADPKMFIGNTSRARFSTGEEMNEFMVQAHNSVVGPEDHVYCLGDFASKREDVERWAPRLNGHNRLVGGNHDIWPSEFYRKHGFQKYYGVRVFEGIMIYFTHIPIAPWSHGKMIANVHGHVHHNKPLVYDVANPDAEGFSLSRRYINLSVEIINYRPVSLAQILALAVRR